MSYHKIKAPCYQSQGKKQKLTILQHQPLSSFHLLFFPFYPKGTTILTPRIIFATILTPWIVFTYFQSLYEWNSTIAIDYSHWNFHHSSILCAAIVLSFSYLWNDRLVYDSLISHSARKGPVCYFWFLTITNTVANILILIFQQVYV